MISFCVWFAWASYGFVAQSYRFASKSEQTDILLWPWMGIIPITMAFVALIALLQLVQAELAPGAADAAAEAAPPASDTL